jgi:pilus assembly protein FimV
MTAKRSSRALALLLALPSAAFALGLGDIRLQSPLNAPLEAEIEVTDVAPDEINTVQARLAPRESFSQLGLDYPTYLTSVQLRLVQTADGRELIKLKSADAITDPFITLLIQVTWSHGQLMREYTMLLDPPVYTPGQPAAASAPVSAPATSAETRAGSIARSTEAPAPAPAPAPVSPAATEAAAPAAEAPAPSATAAESAAPTPSAAVAESAAPAANPAPPPPTAAAAEGANTTHVVQKGETLSEIARGVTGATTNSARTRSWMLAIYQANPRAFDQNMNVMRSGSVLRIPDAAQAEAIAPADAAAEIRRQFTAWRSTAAPAGAAESTAAAPAGNAQAAQPGRLHLVTPSEPASAGAGAAANGAEVATLKGQVKDLEGQLTESKRLLDLKNQELSRLQTELAAKENAKAAPPPPAPAPTQAVAATPAPAEKPPVAAPALPPPAPVTAEQQPAPPPAEIAPPPVTKPLAQRPLPKPVAASKPAPAAEGGSILDTLIGYWWVLALIALVLAVVAGLRYMRSRRATEFDDSLGRLAVAAVAGASGPGGALSGGGSRGSGSLSGLDTPSMRAAPLNEPEPGVVVEETGTHERPRIVTAGAAPPAAAAKHVTADDTISSETAINLDQGDPLAEADFHMAYGLYDQAADLIRIAIGREPGRRDLKLKLLEVFFVWGNKEQFLQTAHELAQTRSEAGPGEWEKILIMGKQLAPEDPLFSSGAAVSGATAGGVDLNLEGGQSRVDFDLLGEPVPTDEPQGVDLDIGSAIGEGTAQMTEATTGVTDRNLTVLEGGGYGNNGAATGSTRQMTSRMRQHADSEGPTVEQPTLDTAEAGLTVRTKPGAPLRSGSAEQTAELAIDDLGLDLGSVDTAEQPGLTAAGAEAPTMVAGLDEKTRKNLEDTAAQAAHVKTSTTGQWQFDQEALESALTQAGAPSDATQSSRLAALRGDTVDVDLSGGSSTGTHQQGNNLDLDVGTATVPDAAFAATQRLESEDLALPDLEPVTMSEVGTKLDLARAYMDMGDPDGARNILEEVLSEGSAAQKQEAQRLMESLPG